MSTSKKRKGIILNEDLSSGMILKSVCTNDELVKDFSSAAEAVGFTGDDGSPARFLIKRGRSSLVKVVCENCQDVKLSDMVSEDEGKKERCRNLIKFLTHLSKIGYTL